MEPVLKAAVTAFVRAEFAEPIAKKVKEGFDPDDFNLNPFTAVVLASGVFGELTPANMAKALAYPKVLGTSVSTTFGNKMQKLCVSHLGAKASMGHGMDIEFVDKVDGRAVIAQLKAGPNTLNADDVAPYVEKYRAANRLLRTNHQADMPVFAMCIAYGTIDQISGHYKNLAATEVGNQEGIKILIGQDFWHRLTGDPQFYTELVNIFIEVFQEENHAKELEDSITTFTKDIETTYFTDGKFDPSKI